MAPAARCDDIVRLIDEALAEHADLDAETRSADVSEPETAAGI